MEKEIKSIDTFYSGYRFRSRLEARWAVFLDNLKIKWEYESEGFELSDGRRYLPDFYILNFSGGFYMEVKPSDFDFASIEAQIIKDFIIQKNTNLLMAIGPPDCSVYKMFEPAQDPINDSIIVVDGLYEWKVYFCDEYLVDEHRFFLEPGDESFASKEYNPRVYQAVTASRSARFEYGERGGVK